MSKTTDLEVEWQLLCRALVNAELNTGFTEAHRAQVIFHREQWGPVKEKTPGFVGLNQRAVALGKTGV